MARVHSALVLFIACSAHAQKKLRGNRNKHCIANNYNSTKKAVPYNQESYYLDFVAHRMRMLAPASEGSVWGRTKGNLISAPDATKSWLLQSPNCWAQANPNTDCGPGKAPGTLALANAVRDTISEAKQWVDITTLALMSSPFASTLCDGIFHEKIVEGMKIALDRNPNVTFRFLAGAPSAASVGLGQNYMSALQKNLGNKYFAIARIFVTPQASEALESWNHAKIVAADSTRSVVGGHNLWDSDYNEKAPVTDVSMTLSGPAAASAHKFADLLWADVCDRQKGSGVARSPAAVEVGKTNPEFVCPKTAIFSNTQAGAISGGVDVISLGQLGVSITPPGGDKGAQLCGANPGHKIHGVSCVPNLPGGYVPEVDYTNDGGDYNCHYSVDNPQEEGIRALLASARHSITIAQQDFIWAGGFGTECTVLPHGAHYDLRLVDILVDKMALESIPVSIVISTPGGKGGYSNMAQMSDFSDVLVSRVRALHYAADDAKAKALLCKYLKLGSLRISPGFDHWKDGTNNRLHAKVHMVDDEAFYIGSKNSYPALLQEFGYVVQDKKAASEFKQQFFEPILEYALTYADPVKSICRL